MDANGCPFVTILMVGKTPRSKMSLFQNRNDSSNDFKPNNAHQSMIELVSDRSVFGRFYAKICDILKDRGVPASRIPSREHFMSRIFDSLDEIKLNSWLEKYSEMEAIKLPEPEPESDSNENENDE